MVGKVLKKDFTWKQEGTSHVQLGRAETKSTPRSVNFSCIWCIFWRECGCTHCISCKITYSKYTLARLGNACWRAKLLSFIKPNADCERTQVVAGLFSMPSLRSCCLLDSVSLQKPGSWGSYGESLEQNLFLGGNQILQQGWVAGKKPAKLECYLFRPHLQETPAPATARKTATQKRKPIIK